MRTWFWFVVLAIIALSVVLCVGGLSYSQVVKNGLDPGPVVLPEIEAVDADCDDAVNVQEEKFWRVRPVKGDLHVLLDRHEIREPADLLGLLLGGVTAEVFLPTGEGQPLVLSQVFAELNNELVTVAFWPERRQRDYAFEAVLLEAPAAVPPEWLMVTFLGTIETFGGNTVSLTIESATNVNGEQVPFAPLRRTIVLGSTLDSTADADDVPPGDKKCTCCNRIGPPTGWCQVADCDENADCREGNGTCAWVSVGGAGPWLAVTSALACLGLLMAKERR